MSEKRLLFVHQKRWPVIRRLEEQLQNTAKKHGIRFQTMEPNGAQGEAIVLRDADYCVVWHGYTTGTAWALKARLQMQKHVMVAEVGLLDQERCWSFDPRGIIGDSSLCDELDWPTGNLRREYYNTRADYSERCARAGQHINVPRGSIVIPLQMARDVAMYAFAPHKMTTQFIEHCKQKFKGVEKPVVFKAHPKQKRVPFEVDQRFTILREGSWESVLCSRPSLVYGQTSTTLTQAALVGLNVEAIGDCPLAYHPNDRETLLAHMIQRQAPRDPSFDLWEHITKHAYFTPDGDSE